MRSRRPTRSDVALRAGVAPSTVTLILGNRGDDLKIPAHTQDRVREAARSLGYYPNPHISAVLKGRSGILGLYLRSDQWSRPYGYWTTVVWHLQRTLAETDAQLLVHNSRPDISTEELFARQAGGVVDGVMILNSGADPIVDRLLEAGLPAIEVGDSFSRLPFVGVDGPQGIGLAMQHLHERGARRPALLGHITNYTENAEARIRAFEQWARELFGEPDPSNRIVRVEGYVNGLQLLQELDPRPDAVLCASDELAYELLAECGRSGVRVPEDLKIVGFDALPTMSAPVAVTSIETPLEELARLAVEKLMAIVDGKPYEQATLLPVGLRIGGTT